MEHPYPQPCPGHACEAERVRTWSMPHSRPLLTAVAILGVFVAGCGEADPTEPRPVRVVDPVGEPPAPTPDARDEDAPTRGLPCDSQGGSLRLCGASTDNYKASFNADPNAPESRTWLAVHELELNGTRYEVVAGQELQPQSVRLRSVDDGDEEVQVVSELVEGPASVSLRVGPQLGLWGPLITLDDDQVVAGSKVIVHLRIVDGPASAVVRLEYVRDDELANAPSESLEHGGPGGRWHVAGIPTATNLELGWE